LAHIRDIRNAKQKFQESEVPLSANKAVAGKEGVASKTISIGLLLPPGFGLPAFASLNDLFYLLNCESPGRPVVECRAVSLDGQAVTSSSGRPIKADCSIRDAHRYDLVIVLAAVSNYTNRIAEAWLRDQRRHGATLGAVTSGLWLLARAGLIGRARCTLHWADYEAFRERNPEANVTADIFVIEDGLITCAGMGAVPDMMFAYFSGRLPKPLLDAVMERLVMDGIRRPQELQRLPASHKFQTTNHLLTAAANRIDAAITERNIVNVLSRELGVSRRWLQALFRRHAGMTIKQFQASCRLDRARQLLTATSLPVSQIAIMTGFSSTSHFCTAFSKSTGKKALEYRRDGRA